VGGTLALLVSAAAVFCYRHGYILYYGDAQSHIDITRSIIDSRTPGYDQIGTVWLPVLHLLCLPFVANDTLWSTGLAGTVPVAACFVVAGLIFYLIAKEVYGTLIAAVVATACLALNPNVLYLAAIPMTEIVFFAGILMLLFALLRFHVTQQLRFIALGIAASWIASLTRYDGWFLIPFAALFCAAFAARKKAAVFVVFAAVASLAPLYWVAHNWWERGNAFDFYNGPESAQAIQGGLPYPGRGNWLLSIAYYSAAGELCAGPALLLAGAVGVVYSIKMKKMAALMFLALTPMFYMWSVHSAGTPIFVPFLPPYSYYNTRYGIAMVVFAAFAVGAIVASMPRELRKFAPVLIVFCASPWLLRPSQEHWICWKESQVNSDGRRAWIASGAAYFGARYQKGEGILVPMGDVMGIFCRARIPLAEVLHRENGPEWMATIARPDLWHRDAWAVSQEGDPVSEGLSRGQATYQAVEVSREPHERGVTIYNRDLPIRR